jgi:hypothetical protein
MKSINANTEGSRLNTRRGMMITKIIGIFLATIALNGCYSFSSMTKTPGFSDNVVVSSKDIKSTKIGYVSNINVKLNNGVANTNDGFVKRVIGKLQQSNYFNDVTYGLYFKKPDVPFYDLSFTVEENQDMNMGGNLTKAFFTGFTLFVLAPVLPNTYDIYTDHYLQAIFPDGTKREYKASCAGSASGTFPYAGLIQEYTKISSDATERCLISIINQFTSDK